MNVRHGRQCVVSRPPRQPLGLGYSMHAPEADPTLDPTRDDEPGILFLLIDEFLRHGLTSDGQDGDSVPTAYVERSRLQPEL